MAIKPSSAKAKGRRLQQWLCDVLSFLTGIPWGPEDDKDIQSRPMAQKGVDVILRGKARDLIRFSFECKNGESFQLVKSIEQARANEEKGRPWVIVHRRKAFRRPVIIMDWKTFKSLLVNEIERIRGDSYDLK